MAPRSFSTPARRTIIAHGTVAFCLPPAAVGLERAKDRQWRPFAFFCPGSPDAGSLTPTPDPRNPVPAGVAFADRPGQGEVGMGKGDGDWLLGGAAPSITDRMEARTPVPLWHPPREKRLAPGPLVMHVMGRGLASSVIASAGDSSLTVRFLSVWAPPHLPAWRGGGRRSRCWTSAVDAFFPFAGSLTPNPGPMEPHPGWGRVCRPAGMGGSGNG
jgi:hypothetical protein